MTELTAPATTLPAMVEPLFRRWRIVLLVPFTLAAITAIVVLIVPSKYEARTSFTAASPTSPSLGGLANIASLAGQFGLPVPALQTSADFLGATLKGTRLEKQLLESRFRDPRAGSDSTVPLIELLGIRGDAPSELYEKGIRTVDRMLAVDVDRRSGIVTLTVQAPWPQLAADIANRMVVLLNQFNLDRQQYVSTEQTRFAGTERDSAERALRAAEGDLQQFLLQNRSLTNSPVLMFERDRLQRRVDLAQEVYVTLARQHEQARIAAAQDVPVLAVVDTAIAPYWRTSPRRKLMVLLVGIFGLLAGAATVSFLDQYQRVRHRNPQEWNSLELAVRNAWTELRAPLRGTHAGDSAAHPQHRP